MSSSFYLKKIRPSTTLITQSFTRPADTTTYADGDAIANSTTSPAIITLADAVRADAGGGILQSALLISSASPSLLLEADLLLFDSTIGLSNDNVAFSPSDADIKKCVAVVQFRSYAACKLGSNVVYDSGSLARSLRAAAGQTTLYAALVARNAYVPASGEEFTLRLSFVQD